ncbi:MAG: pyridoxamine 5'-phosphate oxidase family protein [Gammaproteobacteria bacterium]|nr:pyridoxamine 5'-phosphate oxidase family protein [Gammaproteobacteria bacterium]
MNSIPPFPADFLQAWEEREPLATLATTGPDGTPNVIWVLCMNLTDEARLVVADNAMSKTRVNIDAGSPGALVFLAQPRRAYQLKGPLSYHADGPVFEAMKHGWLDDSYPGCGAVLMEIREIYAGADRVWQRNA